MSKENRQKVVMLHGMDKRELSAMVDLIKKNVPDPQNYLFASTTTTALGFTVEHWINELQKEQVEVRKMIREKINKLKENEG